MTLYSSEAVEKLAEQYRAKGGELTPITEGSLLEYGLAIFHGDGLKTAVIKEKYLNAWSSAYTCRLFNRMPKKYAEMLENSTKCIECGKEMPDSESGYCYECCEKI